MPGGCWGEDSNHKIERRDGPKTVAPFAFPTESEAKKGRAVMRGRVFVMFAMRNALFLVLLSCSFVPAARAQEPTPTPSSIPPNFSHYTLNPNPKPTALG